MYLNVFGKPVIMLGSIQTAFDLLEKKSANCSGRPTTVSMNLQVPGSARLRMAWRFADFTSAVTG